MAEISDFDPTDANNTARWPEGMAPAAINNAARADEGLLARWYRDSDGSIASGGSANAYTVTSNRTIAALADNTVIAFTSNFANTGAATLALNGLTAKAIRRPNGDALVANDIISGQQVVVVYKSSPDYWQLLSPGAFAASDSIIGALAIATQAIMETATSVITAVTPGRQHFHPGMPKAWGRIAEDGTVNAGHGVASVTKNGDGDYTVTLSITLSSVNYAVMVTPNRSTTDDVRAPVIISQTETTFRVAIVQESGNELAVDGFSFVVLGDI